MPTLFIALLCNAAPDRKTDPRKRRNIIDAGDYYLIPDGKRPLHRMAGGLAAKINNAAGKRQESISPGGAGEYRLIAETSYEWAFYEQTADHQYEPQDASALDSVITSARKSSGLAAANPVFIDPESQLWMIATEQIIVRLKPETDPRRYFGSKWPAVRPIPGTTDQFVLSVSTTKAEDVLAEVNKHAADPRVLWAEPGRDNPSARRE